MKSQFKNVKITAIKSIVPNSIINIDDEVKYFADNPKKVNRAKNMIGYGTRHVVDKNTTSLDLAGTVAEQLINETKTDKNSIDTLLFLSQTPDYKLPSSANILHGLIGLSENCAALDIVQGCSGYVYALWLAHSLISSGASKRLLLLAGDTMSKYSYQDNRLINQIFGDSASATLIEYDEKIKTAYFDLGSRGKDWKEICIPAGGNRIPIDEEIINMDYTDNEDNRWNLSHLIMNGLGVFDFTVDVAPKSINELLKYSKLKKEDINLFALHQANKQIVQAVASKADISLEKTPYDTFSKYGNTTLNSVPTVLCQHLTKENCNKVLCCSFGVGLSWATAILDLSKAKNFGISEYKQSEESINQKEYWINRFLKKENNNE